MPICMRSFYDEVSGNGSFALTTRGGKAWEFVDEMLSVRQYRRHSAAEAG
jgi:hypothetical protein